MSSASGFTPLTFPRPRPNRLAVPRVRRVMKLEWNKLFAEATEKDINERVEYDDTGYDEHDGEDNESDCEENKENEGNDGNTNPEMPLNLCYKSNTVPNMSTHFETTDNSTELSTEPKSVENLKNNESDRHISCSASDIQSKNYDVSSTKNQSDSNLSVDKQKCDRRPDNDDIEISGVVNSELGSCNKNNIRTPMKEINTLESSCMSGRKNHSLGNVQHAVFEKPLKNGSVIKPIKSIGESQRVQDNNKNKVEKSSMSCNFDQPNEEDEKKKSSPDSQKDPARFAVPAVPEKAQNARKVIFINGKAYQILAPLGKGGSSSVFLVLNSKNELLAVKCVKLSGVSENIKNDYLNEIQHLLRMQHSKHVIKLYDHQYVSSNKLLYAVMEKGDTDLSRFLKDKAASEEGITPELIMYYWNEMLLAVKSIHDNNIIHRDLKPANFLLVSGRLKLIDFGIASSIQTEQTSILMDSQSGTFNYMSPEALLDLGSGNEVVLKIGRKSDVWSLGCILYYFLYKKTPYQDIVKPLQKMRAITDANYPIKFPKLPGVPDLLIDSCKRCLVHDRKKRASIEELLEIKNRPLLTLSNVLYKLKNTLSEAEYRKAEKVLMDEIAEEN